eukprot:10505351-Alexandrium_andersonii.AAC.1
MSFDVPRSTLGLPKRSRATMIQQAGNVMHLDVIGSAVMWYLMFSETNPTTTYNNMSFFSLARSLRPGALALRRGRSDSPPPSSGSARRKRRTLGMRAQSSLELHFNASKDGGE